jgi:LDH2 family malate/lactate/ureidoglycolate dehydrogenase
MEDTDRPADLGQCFVAIDPQFFAPGFEDRMSALMVHLRGMQPVSHCTSALQPRDNTVLLSYPCNTNMNAVQSLRWH